MGLVRAARFRWRDFCGFGKVLHRLYGLRRGRVGWQMVGVGEVR